MKVTQPQYRAIKLFFDLGYELTPRAFAERMWPEACRRYSNVGSQGAATGQGAQLKAGQWLKKLHMQGLLNRRVLWGSSIYRLKSNVEQAIRENKLEVIR